MFTGLIQGVGTVSARTNDQLFILPPADFAPTGYDEGESITVNGVCLTVVESAPNLVFDISEETWRRTALGSMAIGSEVNLERAMLPTTRFGGHIVQGHVDATASLLSAEGERFAWQVSPEFDRYLIDKGSVSLDGISLTVVNPVAGVFETWIIPHTLAHTNLRGRKAGDQVNIEFDVVAKYVEKLVTR